MDSEIASRTALSDAIEEWRQALGSSGVLSTSEALRSAETATFATSASVGAILSPASHEDVQLCVRIANRFRIPLYPISTGKNWGYGSRAPVSDAVLLDLKRLNRIVDFNEELAYVTVEPGVTQRQLYTFLKEQRSHLWMDATGSSPDCSIVGNTLERGFGHTPMGDHCSHACGYRVVLPSGDTVETGFGRFQGARTAPLGRWGVGPSLDGLFSQSNFGIVTRLTVWLMPAPERFEVFVLRADKPVGPIIDALRPLRMNGTLRSVMHLGNDYKIISGTQQYPWKATAGKTPLGRETMARLRRELQISEWSGSGALYGSSTQVREAKTSLRRALDGKVDRLQFISTRKLRMLRAIAGPYRAVTGKSDLARAAQLLPPLFSVLQGTPTDGFLASAYWRKKTAPPDRIDPDADKCGLLWCSPVAPNTGTDVTTVVDMATGIALEHGFEPIISVSLLTERMTISTIALTYDREVPGEDDRAMACYRSLTERLLAQGYPPYRLNVGSMNYAAGTTDHDGVLRAIKAALDPNNVIAPGRYEGTADPRTAVEGGGFDRKLK